MPDEIGTEAARSDAPSADETPIGDAADDKTAAAVDEQDSDAENAPEQQAADDTGEKVGADKEAEKAPQGSDDAEEGAASTDDLKVVVSIKGGRATIGVQKPSADPHIETFDDDDLSGLAQEVSAVTDRARARWEETPKHPAYERPAQPARRRNRRRQGAAQASTAKGAAELEQAQTPRLF